MALSNIIDRINATAAEEARGVVAQAEKRAQDVQAEARAKADAIKREAIQRAQENAETHKRRLITLASLDLRKQVGDARQQAVEDAFKAGIKQLGSMGDAEYLPLLKSLILEASATGDEQIVLSTRDRARIDDAFLASVNKALSEAGKKGNLTFSNAARPMIGGVILVGDNVEINSTFDSTLKLIRDDIEPEVASLLFGDASSK